MAVLASGSFRGSRRGIGSPLRAWASNLFILRLSTFSFALAFAALSIALAFAFTVLPSSLLSAFPLPFAFALALSLALGLLLVVSNDMGWSGRLTGLVVIESGGACLTITKKSGIVPVTSVVFFPTTDRLPKVGKRSHPSILSGSIADVYFVIYLDCIPQLVRTLQLLINQIANNAFTHACLEPDV